MEKNKKQTCESNVVKMVRQLFSKAVGQLCLIFSNSHFLPKKGNVFWTVNLTYTSLRTIKLEQLTEMTRQLKCLLLQS